MRAGVTARFADGREAALPATRWSARTASIPTLRAQLHPEDGGIRWNGIQMWRGAVDWPDFEGGDTMIVAGDMAESWCSTRSPPAPAAARG